MIKLSESEFKVLTGKLTGTIKARPNVIYLTDEEVMDVYRRQAKQGKKLWLNVEDVTPQVKSCK